MASIAKNLMDEQMGKRRRLTPDQAAAQSRFEGWCSRMRFSQEGRLMARPLNARAPPFVNGKAKIPNYGNEISPG
ncbi:MAG TPA: hypothetical protein PLY52_10610, partial [Methanothrix sp.]|nr:hypothetical protein [Methanothrix sp.]